MGQFKWLTDDDARTSSSNVWYCRTGTGKYYPLSGAQTNRSYPPSNAMLAQADAEVLGTLETLRKQLQVLKEQNNRLKPFYELVTSGWQPKYPLRWGEFVTYLHPQSAECYEHGQLVRPERKFSL